MKKERKQSALSELLEFAGGYRVLTACSVVLSALSALLALTPFVFLYRIIQGVLSVAPDFAQATEMIRNGWMAVGASLLSMLIYFAALICSHVAAFRTAGNIRVALLEKIALLPAGVIEGIGTGKARRIVTESSAATETYLAHRLPDLAASVATPLGILALLFVFDWRFGLASLLPVIFSFMAMWSMAGPNMKEDMRNYQDALSNMSNEATEYVRGIPVVKTFGQTVHSFRRFKASIDNYYKFCISYTKNARRPMMRFTVLLNSAFAFLTALTLILTAGRSVPASLLQSVLFYVIFTPQIATVLNRILFASEDNMVIADSLSRVHSLLDLEPLPVSDSPKVPDGASVEFERVTFRYPGAARDAVSDLSFTAEPGTVTALVGPSGGGKTTVAALISRFFDATSGAVRIGGIDVRDIPPETLSEKIAYVFQDSRLLKRSILENVRLGRPEASREAALDALRRAQCDDILAKLPDGADTVIGAKGTYLSGGERQRIAIARMILRDAPIVVLDEATAFADPENEALVQKSFEELAKGKTVLMIAHRLTTVRNADNILVLRDGKLEESGSHEELIRKGGLYKSMWDEYQSAVQWKVGVSA